MAEPGWYIVTTIELAREVLTDPARFSNQVSRRTSPPAEVADEVAAIRSQGFGYVPTLLLNDPPAHTRYRRMVQRALTPRALAWMEPLIADVAAELARALPDGSDHRLHRGVRPAAAGVGHLPRPGTARRPPGRRPPVDRRRHGDHRRPAGSRAVGPGGA